MNSDFYAYLSAELSGIRDAGFFKHERVITGPQSSEVPVETGETLINLCSNNYLGLAQHPDLRDAARAGLERWGYGMASVRFICGTQSVHKELEGTLTKFLQTEDTILYPSCYDANGGLFEVLLGENDAVISDELNHASIIDGIRLCKAKRYRYRNNDMQDLEDQLRAAEAAGSRFKLISTDGVFSMDGSLAKLDEICDLADRYDAIVHVDDSHATGVVGPGGRGTPEYFNCANRVDVLTGTLGKALGGASGGYTSGRREIVELLRQRSRPYLFSNTVAPPLVAGAIAAVELAEKGRDIRARLAENTATFRHGLETAGFDVLPGQHPIVPVMLYDAHLATELAEALLKYGVYVIPFSFPVVPKGKARIRCQMTAAFTSDEVNRAVEAFSKARAEIVK
ncbi:2-amino-3-ketobutyrate coenzyme A ligase [Hyphomonas adhaerens MHS-3]|uniref:2-amino-3-ketobutyrate coenzyme A ligase n=1 Tax=Hyphomonas adhaerens MHS-3 TaxID=1280949 RepID=A0A069E819_9PROT|nr:glycine C-acetyltransferase [Hyphomonas adhaerens]KCZ86197.1 2-amino-3-ketobutyrate coenzyme A ligase [Hyphomonas adhaerens MHS-3]